MIDVHAIMTALSRDRPAFHSEADFQHAFAWRMQMGYPHLRIRLEYPFHCEDETIDHVDIVAFDKNETTALEIKYKTAPFFAPLKEDLFYLKGHSAQDLGRYDFLKDVYRIEKYTAQRRNWAGYAVLLTNDSAYWNPSNRRRSVCDEFRLTDKRMITGELSWGEAAGKGTTKGREVSIRLKGSYTCEWFDYSEFKESEYVEGSGKFRYLAIGIAWAGHSRIPGTPY